MGRLGGGVICVPPRKKLATPQFCEEICNISVLASLIKKDDHIGIVSRDQEEQMILRSAAVLSPAACLLLLAASTSYASVSPVSRALLSRAPQSRSDWKLNQKGDDDDKISDPDAYVPQGSGKTKTCQTLAYSPPNRLTLRGGAAEETKPTGPKLQVVFVSAEIAPWSVTGGLGAVRSSMETFINSSVTANT